MNSFILPSYTLFRRELTLFIRQKHRVIGALLQPLVFWFLIGSGLNASFKPETNSGLSYSEYFFPGIVLMVIMFTSIFSTISIIEDRNQGFLKSVLVAPVTRSSIVFGKVLGGTCLGMIQGVLFLLLLLTPLVTMTLTASGFVSLLVWMFLMGFCLTALGTLIAWKMDSMHGYHAVMSIFLFPLWIFSGAAFPMEGAPSWLFWIMNVNPLTHGLKLMRQCFYLDSGSVTLTAKQALLSGSYVVFFCILIFSLASWKVSQRE